MKRNSLNKIKKIFFLKMNMAILAAITLNACGILYPEYPPYPPIMAQPASPLPTGDLLNEPTPYDDNYDRDPYSYEYGRSNTRQRVRGPVREDRREFYQETIYETIDQPQKMLSQKKESNFQQRYLLCEENKRGGTTNLDCQSLDD